MHPVWTGSDSQLCNWFFGARVCLLMLLLGRGIGAGKQGWEVKTSSQGGQKPTGTAGSDPEGPRMDGQLWQPM